MLPDFGGKAETGNMFKIKGLLYLSIYLPTYVSVFVGFCSLDR